MKTNTKIILMLVNLLLLLLYTNISSAQDQAKVHLKNLAFIKPEQKFVQIKFELINNLVVIPLSVNGSDTLHFILDSGASYVIVCDPTVASTLNLDPRKTRKVALNGMGTEGPLEAFHSWGNKLTLKGIEGLNQDVIYPNQDIFKLSDSMGMKIHGLVGAIIFNHFIVNIDYKRKILTLYQKEYYYTKKRKKLKKRFESIPMVVRKNRAYIESHLLSDNTVSPHKVSLLIDTGASHALSIFESEHHPLKASIKAIRDHLGVGISGDLYGKVNRLERLDLGSFELENPIVKYPDLESIGLKVSDSSRHGSIGSEILRRFTVIFDYENQELLVKKNTDFRDEFHYNHLGLEFTNPYPGLPFFQISQIRDLSPAAKAGIQEGDRILKVNGQSVAYFTPEELRVLFRGKAGRRLSIAIENTKGQSRTYLLKLEDPFSQN